MLQCCAVATEAVIEAVEASNIQDIVDAAKKNAAQPNRTSGFKVLIREVKYDNTVLFEIAFLDRVVRAAEGK